MIKALKNHEVWIKIKPWVYLSTYILVFAVILWNLQTIGGYIGFIFSLFKTLFYGIIFAYVLNQPMKRIEAWMIKHTKETSFLRRKKRPIAMVMTILIAIIILIVAGSIILPNITASLVQLFNNLSGFFGDVIGNLDDILAYFNINVRLESLSQVEEFVKMPWNDIVTQLINILGISANGIVSNATAFVGTFALWFTGFMFSLYLLSNKETFIRQLRKAIAAIFGYNYAVVIFRYATRTNKIFSSFIGGQLVEACILWVLYYTSMLLLGFPYPELIATLIAVCSLVPVFGSMFAMSIGAIMILSINWQQAIWFIIFYQLMQQFEDNVIYPRVVGNSVGLPGLWVLLSIFVFGDMFGIFGMIIAVPVTACLYSLCSEAVNYILKKRSIEVDENEMRMIKKDDATIE